MTVVCGACGASVEPENFCTQCGARLPLVAQVAVPASAPVVVGAEQAVASAAEAPSTASRVWDGVERVGSAVTSVFAVIVGLCWVAIGIAVFVAAANGYGNGWSWLIGIGAIVYGIFLILPTRGTKLIIY